MVKKQKLELTWIGKEIQPQLEPRILIEDPELVKKICGKYPGKIAVGIDAKDGFVAVPGWVENTTQKASEMAKQFEECGVSVIIFTDIMRDGTLTGPNLESTRELAESINIPVIASGGVSELKDIEIPWH